MQSRSTRHGDRRVAAAALVAAFVLFDFPILVHPFVSVWGFPVGDYGPALWNFWATARALGQGQSPFLTHMLFGGRPASLFYHTLNPFYFVATAPFYYATRNVFVAFNASTLLGDALGLLFFYRLARALRGTRLLSALGAVCFVFCAYRLQHWPTLNLLSTWTIPFYSLALLRVWQKARLRDGARLGLAVVVLLLCDWHYLMFLAIASPFLIAWFVTRSGAAWIDRRRALAIGVAVLVASPVFVPYVAIAVRHAALSERAPYNNLLRVHWSASPLYYVVPGWLERRVIPERPREGSDARFADAERIRNRYFHSYKIKDARSLSLGNEFSLYLGLIPMVLFGFYVASGRLRRDLPLLAALAAFAFLSLGPALVWLDPVRIGPGRYLVLPTAKVFELPILSSTKHVSRFGLMVLFLMSVLASSRSSLGGKRRWGRGGAWAFLFLLLLLHRLDLDAFVRRVEPYAPSPALREALLAGSARAGNATVFPGTEWETEGAAMYLQTLHGRSLFSGYLSRLPVGAQSAIESDPFYAWLETARREGGEEATEIESFAPDRMPACVILLRRYLAPAERERATRRLRWNHAFDPAYEDDNVVVFWRTDRERASSASRPGDSRQESAFAYFGSEVDMENPFPTQ
ncbi:hypothetical protein JW916_03485 [Candidatus Sumerlaeota bacterium]|nr:hypothetical protein [Candidatus Sumerlaeota bacterium]